jgi:hypothetical protein
MSPLIDRIYECAFVPDLWPEILAKLVQLDGGLSGWLCISNGNVVRWAASSEEARNDLRPLMDSGWIPRSERYNRLLRAKHTGFIPDSILYKPGEMQNDPAYRDMLYPRGMQGYRIWLIACKRKASSQPARLILRRIEA